MLSLCCGSGQVKRKILVLDLDETLIHSHHDGVLRPTVRPGTPPDFILKVCGGGMVMSIILIRLGLPFPVSECVIPILIPWHPWRETGSGKVGNVLQAFF